MEKIKIKEKILEDINFLDHIEPASTIEQIEIIKVKSQLHNSLILLEISDEINYISGNISDIQQYVGVHC